MQCLVQQNTSPNEGWWLNDHSEWASSSAQTDCYEGGFLASISIQNAIFYASSLHFLLLLFPSFKPFEYPMITQHPFFNPVWLPWRKCYDWCSQLMQCWFHPWNSFSCMNKLQPTWIPIWFLYTQLAGLGTWLFQDRYAYQNYIFCCLWQWCTYLQQRTLTGQFLSWYTHTLHNKNNL